MCPLQLSQLVFLPSLSLSYLCVAGISMRCIYTEAFTTVCLLITVSHINVVLGLAYTGNSSPVVRKTTCTWDPAKISSKVRIPILLSDTDSSDDQFPTAG
jgi:hypothetical protein